MFAFLTEKIWKLLLPYLEGYLPSIFDNMLEVKLEKIKSELKQREQRNEASNKAFAFIQAIEDVSQKNYPIEILSAAIKSACPNLSDNEIVNAITTCQKARKICNEHNIDWEINAENNDWFREFFRLSGKFSADDAHDLWGRVLAQEIKESGSISFRAMNTIANLTPKECQEFISLFPYIIDGRYIFAEQEIYSKCKLNKHLQMLFELEDTGIIKYVSSPVTLTIQTIILNNTQTERTEGVSFRTISNTLTIMKTYEVEVKNNHRIFDLTPFPNTIRSIDLTKVGREIFTALRTLIDHKDQEFAHESSKYLEQIATYLKNHTRGKVNIEITDKDSDEYYRK